MKRTFLIVFLAGSVLSIVLFFAAAMSASAATVVANPADADVEVSGTGINSNGTRIAAPAGTYIGVDGTTKKAAANSLNSPYFVYNVTAGVTHSITATYFNDYNVIVGECDYPRGGVVCNVTVFNSIPCDLSASLCSYTTNQIAAGMVAKVVWEYQASTRPVSNIVVDLVPNDPPPGGTDNVPPGDILIDSSGQTSSNPYSGAITAGAHYVDAPCPPNYTAQVGECDYSASITSGGCNVTGFIPASYTALSSLCSYQTSYASQGETIKVVWKYTYLGAATQGGGTTGTGGGTTGTGGTGTTTGTVPPTCFAPDVITVIEGQTYCLPPGSTNISGSAGTCAANLQEVTDGNGNVVGCDCPANEVETTDSSGNVTCTPSTTAQNNGGSVAVSGGSPVQAGSGDTGGGTGTTGTGGTGTTGTTGNPASGLIPCGADVQSSSGGVDAGATATSCNFAKLVTLFQNVINFMIVLSIPIATIVFVYIGVTILTSQGDVAKISRAKKIAWNLMIGFLFILCAWLLIYAISTALLNPSYNFFLKSPSS